MIILLNNRNPIQTEGVTFAKKKPSKNEKLVKLFRICGSKYIRYVYVGKRFPSTMRFGQSEAKDQIDQGGKVFKQYTQCMFHTRN